MRYFPKTAATPSHQQLRLKSKATVKLTIALLMLATIPQAFSQGPQPPTQTPAVQTQSAVTSQDQKVSLEQKLALEHATSEVLRAQINILLSSFRANCEKQGSTLGTNSAGYPDCVPKPPTPTPAKATTKKSDTETQKPQAIEKKEDKKP